MHPTWVTRLAVVLLVVTLPLMIWTASKSLRTNWPVLLMPVIGLLVLLVDRNRGQQLIDEGREAEIEDFRATYSRSAKFITLLMLVGLAISCGNILRLLFVGA